MWDMPDTPSPAPGQTVAYAVEIDNVMVNGQAESFSYTTTSFDPATTTAMEPVLAQVAFLEPAVLVQASAGSVTVEVARSMNDDGPFSVNYATVEGSATAGTNYTATSGVLTFAQGQFYESITIPIGGGLVPASGATFSIVLSAPTGAALGQYSTVNVTLSPPPPPSAPIVSGLTGNTSTSTSIFLHGSTTPDTQVLVYDEALWRAVPRATCTATGVSAPAACPTESTRSASRSRMHWAISPFLRRRFW